MSTQPADLDTLFRDFRSAEQLDHREIASLLRLPFPVPPSDPSPPVARHGKSAWAGMPQLDSLYRHPSLAGQEELVDRLLAGAVEEEIPQGKTFNLATGQTGGLLLLLTGRCKLLHNPPRFDADGERTKDEIPSLLAWLGPGSWLGLGHTLEAIMGRELMAAVPGAREGMSHAEVIRLREARFQEQFRELRALLAAGGEAELLDQHARKLRELYTERRNFLGVMSLTLSDEAAVKGTIIGSPGRGTARCLRVPVAHVVEVAAQSMPLRMWLVQQFFLTRMGSPMVREIMEAHPLLTNLDVTQRSFLSATAAYRIHLGDDGKLDPEGPRPYLPARTRGGRVALILEGQAQSYLPGRSRQDQGRLVGTFGPGELIGHEDLVTAEDFETYTVEATPDAVAARAGTQDLMAAEEPRRRAEVYLAPGTVLLEWDWTAFRRAMTSTPGSWVSMIRYARRGCRVSRTTSVPIYGVLGDQPGVGVTSTALGLAVALARRPELQPVQRAAMLPTPVILVDFDGERTWTERWQHLGFQRRDLLMPQAEDPLTGEARPPIPGTILLCSHGGCGRCEELPERIRVVWTRRLQDTVDLVSFATWSDHLRRIVVSGASVTRERWAGIRNALNQNDITVVWLNNEPGAHYEATAELPRHLVRVDRMDQHYIARARERAAGARIEWNKPAQEADLRSYALVASGHMRLPDDARSVDELWRCDFDAVWSRADRRGLADCLDRLARIVEGETVGLALSGGGPLGCCQIALLEELQLARVPIDYLAGSSVGAVVGALYAAGGLPLIERFLRDHAPTGFEDASFLKAFLILLRDSPFARSLTTGALWDTEMLGQIIDDLGKEAFGGEDLPLECTYLPFYPVSANLNSQAPFTTTAGSLGLGVRTAAGMPPSIPGVWRSEERLLDGALIQNVPSNLLRQHGADFLVAVNVMKPPLGVTEGRMQRALYNATFGRVEDVVRGIFLLAWKAGDDQGRLDANHLVDFRTEGAWLIEWWRGWRLREVARQQLEQRQVAARIAVHYAQREAWELNQVDIIDVDVSEPPPGGDIDGAPGKPWWRPRR